MKGNKKIIITLAIVILIASTSTNVFAKTSTTSTKTIVTTDELNKRQISACLIESSKYYKLEKKKYINTQTTRLTYLTNAWAKASQYVTQDTKTKTSTIGVSVSSGEFLKSKVIGALGANFNSSVSESFSVGTYLPANSKKLSKLAVYQKRKKYSGTLYYVVDYGVYNKKTKKGTGYVYEPVDLYLTVEYK